jgi:uncharacterized protein YydD (DUF2326 family)
MHLAKYQVIRDIATSATTVSASAWRSIARAAPVSNMEIFCYDLMLAERWATKRPGSIDLIHDSNLFADVDDRQIAAALELAADKASRLKFQYICTFNSDKLPLSEFSKGFDIASFTRLRLTDETEDGGLLGIRLPSAATRAPRSSSKTFDLLNLSRAGPRSNPRWCRRPPS